MRFIVMNVIIFILGMVINVAFSHAAETLAPAQAETAVVKNSEMDESLELKLVAGAQSAAESNVKANEKNLEKEIGAVDSSKIGEKTNSISANLKEDQIPLFAKSAEKKAVTNNPMTRVAVTSFLFIALMVGVYFFGRKYSQSKIKRNEINQIKVLATHHLGPKKTLAVVSIAGESMLLGITDNQINLIKTLSLLDEEIPEQTPSNFKTTLTKAQAPGFIEEQEEDFAFSKIKDVVAGRLKGMKEL